MNIISSFCVSFMHVYEYIYTCLIIFGMWMTLSFVSLLLLRLNVADIYFLYNPTHY